MSREIKVWLAEPALTSPGLSWLLAFLTVSAGMVLSCALLMTGDYCGVVAGFAFNNFWSLFNGVYAQNTALFLQVAILDIVFTNSLLTFSTAMPLKFGHHAIIISYTVFCIAFVVAVVHTRVENFNHSPVEARRELRAVQCHSFRRVRLPTNAVATLIIGVSLRMMQISQRFNKGACNR